MGYYTYIIMTQNNTALYVGVTNDLIRRIYEHKQKIADGHTKKYNIDKLVYYEIFDDPENAIKREKQLKGWVRKKKINLIQSMNEDFRDLYDDLNK